jgi:ferric-dicitrate binding protein FerR (iron transport regulator)
MVNDQFIRLLTKELCEQLTDAERAELNLFLRDKKYSDQRQLLKEYWERDKGEHEANTTMFKKVIEKIRTEVIASTPEQTRQSEPGHAGQPEYPITEPAILPFPRKKSLPPATWYSAAAILLLLIGPIIYYSSKTRPAPAIAALQWLQKTTLPTKKFVLTLSDGTIVTLNSATTIKYPVSFNDSTREVYLEGEAFFDVSKDTHHPFIIHTDKMNIRVLGTSFNVKSYRNETSSEASLIKGSIEVTLNDRPSDRIILKPKEKLVVQNNLAAKHPVNAGAQDTLRKSTRYALTNLTYFPNTAATVIETSWVENKLVFTDKDFAELSGQLERWYGVHIEFKNERVKQYNFTGFFEKETLAEALDALKMIEHFDYKIADSIVSIY